VRWLQLRDIADIPASLPRPVLPALGLVPTLLLPAIPLAFMGLVQGAAISQIVPNPDGTSPDTSDDFRGQGVANVASGLLRGMPVGRCPPRRSSPRQGHDVGSPTRPPGS
jgi:sulfate permease, SulP family